MSVQATLLGNVSSSLSSSQAAVCEGFLSLDECFSALSGMAKRKAPGLDGLPAEFYGFMCHVPFSAQRGDFFDF